MLLLLLLLLLGLQLYGPASAPCCPTSYTSSCCQGVAGFCRYLNRDFGAAAAQQQQQGGQRDGNHQAASFSHTGRSILKLEAKSTRCQYPQCTTCGEAAL
jgi:hypothetical protein